MTGTSLAVGILAVLLRFHTETDEPNREQRLAIIASAVVTETETPPKGWPWSSEQLAWAVVATTYHETGFKRAAHIGTSRGDQGRSVCLGQIMLGGEDLVGEGRPATRRCIRRVAEILALHARGCVWRPGKRPQAWQMARVFNSYGTGRTCKPARWSWRRAGTWQRLARFAD